VSCAKNQYPDTANIKNLQFPTHKSSFLHFVNPSKKKSPKDKKNKLYAEKVKTAQNLEKR